MQRTVFIHMKSSDFLISGAIHILQKMACLKIQPRFLEISNLMSLVMRKPAFCICENKDADQLCGNHEADQRLCFRCTDSTIPLLPKSEISSLLPSSVAVQPSLCRTWSETPKTGLLRMRLISYLQLRFLCPIPPCYTP